MNHRASKLAGFTVQGDAVLQLSLDGDVVEYLEVMATSVCLCPRGKTPGEVACLSFSQRGPGGREGGNGGTNGWTFRDAQDRIGDEIYTRMMLILLEWERPLTVDCNRRGGGSDSFAAADPGGPLRQIPPVVPFQRPRTTQSCRVRYQVALAWLPSFLILPLLPVPFYSSCLPCTSLRPSPLVGCTRFPSSSCRIAKKA